MSIGTKIFTLFNGYYVGNDNFGNKYYSNSKNFNSKKAKRWVIYKGKPEASNVPAHWHAWLHKMTESPPINYNHDYFWQKDHKSNKTGTSEAYFPKSYTVNNFENKSENNEDYEIWKPK